AAAPLNWLTAAFCLAVRAQPAKVSSRRARMRRRHQCPARGLLVSMVSPFLAWVSPTVVAGRCGRARNRPTAGSPHLWFFVTDLNQEFTKQYNPGRKIMALKLTPSINELSINVNLETQIELPTRGFQSSYGTDTMCHIGHQVNELKRLTALPSRSICR